MVAGAFKSRLCLDGEGGGKGYMVTRQWLRASSSLGYALMGRGEGREGIYAIT